MAKDPQVQQSELYQKLLNGLYNQQPRAVYEPTVLQNDTPWSNMALNYFQAAATKQNRDELMAAQMAEQQRLAEAQAAQAEAAQQQALVLSEQFLNSMPPEMREQYRPQAEQAAMFAMANPSTYKESLDYFTGKGQEEATFQQVGKTLQAVYTAASTAKSKDKAVDAQNKQAAYTAANLFRMLQEYKAMGKPMTMYDLQKIDQELKLMPIQLQQAAATLLKTQVDTENTQVNTATTMAGLPYVAPTAEATLEGKQLSNQKDRLVMPYVVSSAKSDASIKDSQAATEEQKTSEFLGGAPGRQQEIRGNNQRQTLINRYQRGALNPYETPEKRRQASQLYYGLVNMGKPDKKGKPIFPELPQQSQDETAQTLRQQGWGYQNPYQYYQMPDTSTKIQSPLDSFGQAMRNTQNIEKQNLYGRMSWYANN